jgi:hypothetical protein
MLAMIWRALIRELSRVDGALRARWRDRKIVGFAATLLLFSALVTAHVADSYRPGESWVNDCCTEQDSYPFLTWLWRIPGSVIAPARDLPVWGSALQVLVVVGIAEAAFGTRRTMLVAAAGHFVATFGARVLLWLGPGYFLGLPALDGRLPDTGPSAVTVALTAYLAVGLRSPIMGSLATGGIASAALVHSDLAGREHLVAWLVGACCGAVQLLVSRSRAKHGMREFGNTGVLVRL